MNILLIDSNVTDHQIIVESCNTNTLPFVYSYHSTRDEISKFFSYISHKINRIGIFADQNAKLFLDDELFFVENENTLILSDNSNFMVQLINDYDISYIDYFACNTLNDPNWVNYFDILMSLTNVIVGASNNETGNIQYGGDWIMENTCQDIESIYFSKNIEYYTYLLGYVTNFFVGTGTAKKDITEFFKNVNSGGGGGNGKLITTNYSDNYGDTGSYGSGFRYFNGIIYADMIHKLDVAIIVDVASIPAATGDRLTNFNVLYLGYYYDIGQLINLPDPPEPEPVYGIFNLGIPSADTWLIASATSNKLSTSNWIWNANSTGKPTVPSNVNILFSYNYYSSTASITTGTFYAAVVGVGYLYFNGAGPTYIGTETITGLSGASLIGTTVTPVTGSMTIVPDFNYIQIVCYNSGISSPAGLIASFYNGETLDVSSNDTWTSEIVSSASLSNSLATVVKGGLNTTIYSVGTNYFLYNNTTAGSRIQSYYYNNIDLTIIKSTNIVNNFGAITDISSTCITNVGGSTYGSNYWGFKASGFFVPPSTSKYTFTLTSNDYAEIWIGPTACTPSSASTLKSSSSTTTYTTPSNLTANMYYPILIFYGQHTLGQNFSLVIKRGTSTGTILTHSDVLYYVNYNLPPPSRDDDYYTKLIGSYTYFYKDRHYIIKRQQSCVAHILMYGPGGNPGVKSINTFDNTDETLWRWRGGGGGGGGEVVYSKINIDAGIEYSLTLSNSSDSIFSRIENGIEVIKLIAKKGNNGVLNIGGTGGTNGNVGLDPQPILLKSYPGINGDYGSSKNRNDGVGQSFPTPPTTILRDDINSDLYDNIKSLARQMKGNDISAIKTSTGGGSGDYAVLWTRTVSYNSDEFPNYTSYIYLNVDLGQYTGIGNGGSYVDLQGGHGGAYIYFEVV